MADARNYILLYHGLTQKNKNSLKNHAYKTEPYMLRVNTVFLFYLLFFHKYEDCYARHFLRTITEYCPSDTSLHRATCVHVSIVQTSYWPHYLTLDCSALLLTSKNKDKKMLTFSFKNNFYLVFSAASESHPTPLSTC